jgi:hypothetical protein
MTASTKATDMNRSTHASRSPSSARRAGGPLLSLLALAGIAALAPTALGCSDSGGSGGDAAAAAGGTAGAGGADAQSGAGGEGGDFFTNSSNNSVGNGGSDAGAGGACASESFDAELVPLDIYIAFDQSYSMNKPAGDSGTRWEAVTDALKAFVQLAPPDTSVGLQYFPLFQGPVMPCATDADCSGGFCLIGEGGGHCLPEPAYDCSAASYATPDVPIGALPGNESALIASLDAHYPYGGTPTSAALQGAIDYARAWAEGHPTHKTIVVLATDGYPKDCAPTDIESIATIAGAGLQGTPAVSTFVVGVGDGLDNLDAIASAGGTDAAFLVTDQNATAEFASALETIRKSMACEFVVPAPVEGEADFEKVNVQFTPGGGQPSIIGQVAGAADCGNGGGWYYDDAANPEVILLCADTCSTAKADANGKVDVLLGCKTIIQEPK